MIFEVFTAKGLKKNISLLIIIILGLTLRVYKLGEAFPFDFDQEIPAIAAYDFFINRKLTLIGQELSFKGFFLGPLHNWIQFIPYGLCNLKPDCVPFFYITIGIVTIVILYLVLKKIFDNKIATIASAIYAISFAAIGIERGVNSNFFLFLTSIGLLFSLYKYFLGKDIYLITGSFLAGIATVNFNPVFIFSSLAFFTTALFRKRRSIVLFILGISALLVNYTPLLLFNFRHDNIIWNNFQKFISQNSATSGYFDRVVFLTKDVALPFYSNYFFQSANKLLLALTFFLIILGFYLIIKTKDNFLMFLPIWMIITIFGFVFYKGHMPDYYFQQTLLPLIILVSLGLRKSLLVFVIFTSIFFFTNLIRNINFHSDVNYQAKKRVVDFIVNESSGNSFNVFYDMPPGLNTGYSYLFKISGHEPQEAGKYLYFLEFVDPTHFRKYKYSNVFPDKKITVNVIGFVHIVSVK